MSRDDDEALPSGPPADWVEAGPTSPLKLLADALGHDFTNLDLLLQALTHRSYVNECDDDSVRDNERLEFLGDAVIDLIVSEELMSRHSEAQEGALSRMRASVVSETGLSTLARQVGVGPALRLGRGEELSGGRDKPSLLADAFEALMAAVYVDGGLEAVRNVLLGRVGVLFEGASSRDDPKTELQQYMQSERRLTPTYRVVDERGPDHSKHFVVEILVGDEVLGTGDGRTKKEAERSAAARVLAELGSK